MEDLWNGFAIRRMEFEGREALVVFPAPGTSNGRLLLKTEYWDAFPNAIEVPLVEQGFHLCFIRNDHRWGGDADLDRKARFVRGICAEYGLSEKVVLVGMSCGGLMAIKFAARYPKLVSCLYLDAPVLNYMSCPCGFGEGDPLSDDGIQEILDALKMKSISQLICYRDMPMDKIPELIKHKLPVVMVAGGSDRVVPYHENGLQLQKAYEEAGLEFAFFMKPECAHHPHGLEDPRKVVEFILSRA